MNGNLSCRDSTALQKSDRDLSTGIAEYFLMLKTLSSKTNIQPRKGKKEKFDHVSIVDLTI